MIDHELISQHSMKISTNVTEICSFMEKVNQEENFHPNKLQSASDHVLLGSLQKSKHHPSCILPLEVYESFFWNTSGAPEIPNVILLYLSGGVMKVVNACDSLVKGICQKPLLTSSILNTVPPTNSAGDSSNFLNGLL